jgi:hypothetical protein
MKEKKRNNHYSDQNGHFIRGMANRLSRDFLGGILLRTQGLIVADSYIIRAKMKRITSDGKK